MKLPVVFLVCTGLEHVSRGYESFSRECFNELKTKNQFDLYLIKGSGPVLDRELVVSCIKRNSFWANLFEKCTGKSAYFIEQFSFFLNFILLLLKYRPSIIYYSDFQLGTFLWHFRQLFSNNYKLVFSNGAPNGPPFTRTDHVQQLLPFYYKDACSKGTSPNVQSLLPYGIVVQKPEIITYINNKDNIRRELGLPIDKKIIISVGAINNHHKRMCYIIEEFSTLDTTKFYLVILGQIDEQSREVINLARKVLDDSSYKILQTDNITVRKYMVVSDYFILASLSEGLPRVLPEALSAGLLPIVHDYTVTRETLGDYGVYLDLSKKGSLEVGLKHVNKVEIDRGALIDYAVENYSWIKLGEKYVAMLLSLCE